MNIKPVQTNRTIETQYLIERTTMHNLDGHAFLVDMLEFREYPDGEVQVRGMGKRLNKDGSVRSGSPLQWFWLDDIEEQMALVWYKGQS